MKTLSFLAAVSAFLLFTGSSGAQTTGYDDYFNDGAKVIINNYYDGYVSDYYYSSRINRFHRSYAVFDYYSPVFTDTYWYDYDPFSWGVSIYGGGFGLRLGYSPYYYSPYYYSLYDPYYYDPYFYGSYWGYYPRWYSYWYAPSFCWGLRSLLAGLTWAFYRPFHYHHHFLHYYGHSYYSHNNGFYDFNRRYSSDNYRRYEASGHDPGRNTVQNSRRGVIDNGSSGNIRRYDGNLRNEGTGNPESRRSGSLSLAGSDPGGSANRSSSGSRRVYPSYQERSSGQRTGQIEGNYRSNPSVRRDSYIRSYGTNTETRQAPVRRQESNSSQGRSGSITRLTPVRRNESYSQPYRSALTVQSQYSDRNGTSPRRLTGNMPQSVSRSSSNNYRSRSVDMGRISRPSGQSGSMRSIARSSGSSHGGRASISPGRSSGSSRSSGSGHSGASSGRR